jgi:hypothetical protein
LFYFKRKVAGVWEDGKFFEAYGANSFVIDQTNDEIHIPFQGDMTHIYTYDIAVADFFDAAAPSNTAPTATNRTQTVNFTEDTTAAIANIVVTDPDGDTFSATITMASGNSSLGSLSASSGNGETYTTAAVSVSDGVAARSPGRLLLTARR